MRKPDRALKRAYENEPVNANQAGIHACLIMLSMPWPSKKEEVAHIEELLIDLDNDNHLEMLQTMPKNSSVTTTWLSGKGKRMTGKYYSN